MIILLVIQEKLDEFICMGCTPIRIRYDKHIGVFP